MAWRRGQCDGTRIMDVFRILRGVPIRDRCSAEVVFTGRDLDTLLAVEGPAHELELYRHCELESRHGGPHAVLAQQCNGGDWWLLWSWAGRDLGIRAPCDAEDAIHNPNEPNPCLLPARHSGVHSFELGPADHSVISIETQEEHIQRLVTAYRNGVPLNEYEDHPPK